MIWGKSAAPGIGIGRALVLNDELPKIEKKTGIESTREWERFRKAIDLSKKQLTEIRDQAARDMGPDKAAIFDSHLLVLEDPELISMTQSKMESEKTNAEWAFDASIREFAAMFEQMSDEYLRERAADLRDVGSRVLRNSMGIQTVNLATLDQDVVLIAHDLTPSQTAAMNKKHVMGILTDIGGKTSHTAILARTLEIPAVLGLKNITEVVKTGDLVAFNGQTGEVHVNPDESLVKKFQIARSEDERAKRELSQQVGLESVTRDGRRVVLEANIGAPSDLPLVLKNDSEGIGLFRTEILFMDREKMPSEEEQFQVYKEVLQTLGKKHVIIRTLDIGGDKQIPYMKIAKEENPFLGCRAIRYCLLEPEILRVQFRSLLRASHFGSLGIMIPMISNVQEVLQTRAIFEDEKTKLKSMGVPFDPHVQFGIMIEIPAAAVMSDVLARHVDFFSIGTNDLIQYVCAVDRMNEKVHDLYDPCHPAVIRLIHQTIQNGHKEGIMVGMCGEMAGSLEMMPLLLGLGLKHFSMSPATVLKARKYLRGLSYARAQVLARECLEAPTSDTIRSLIEKFSN